jgi:hypothetical protein
MHLNAMTIVVGVILCSAAPESGPPVTKAAVTADVLAIAADLRRAIEERDAPGILKYMGPQGAVCADTVVHAEEVREKLADRSSWIHAYLFDEEAWKRFASVFDQVNASGFFRRAKGITVDVRYGVALPAADSACFTYRSTDLGAGPEFCVRRARDGRWYFLRPPGYCA